MMKKFKSYKNRAIAKGLEFTLNKFTFMSKCKSPCYICGIKDINKDNGIDRVDNNRGYIDSNIASCCWICNRAKNNMSLSEFKTWLNRLSDKPNETFNEAKEVTELCTKYNTDKYEEALCGKFNDFFNQYNIKVTVTDIRPSFRRRTKEELEAYNT